LPSGHPDAALPAWPVDASGPGGRVPERVYPATLGATSGRRRPCQGVSSRCHPDTLGRFGRHQPDGVKRPDGGQTSALKGLLVEAPPIRILARRMLPVDLVEGDPARHGRAASSRCRPSTSNGSLMSQLTGFQSGGAELHGHPDVSREGDAAVGGAKITVRRAGWCPPMCACSRCPKRSRTPAGRRGVETRSSCRQPSAGRVHGRDVPPAGCFIPGDPPSLETSRQKRRSTRE
jgi:hypothetical protein